MKRRRKNPFYGLACDQEEAHQLKQQSLQMKQMTNEPSARKKRKRKKRKRRRRKNKKMMNYSESRERVEIEIVAQTEDQKSLPNQKIVVTKAH